MTVGLKRQGNHRQAANCRAHFSSSGELHDQIGLVLSLLRQEQLLEGVQKVNEAEKNGYGLETQLRRWLFSTSRLAADPFFAGFALCSLYQAATTEYS